MKESKMYFSLTKQQICYSSLKTSREFCVLLLIIRDCKKINSFHVIFAFSSNILLMIMFNFDRFGARQLF